MPKNKTAPLTTWQSMVAAKQRTDGRSHGYRCAIRKPPAKAALAYTLRRDVNSKRVRTFIATTSQVALDDGVLLPDGMDSRVFDERPVVLWAHRDEDIGIGRVLARRRTKDPDGWEMDVEFAPADVNSFSDAVLRFMDWSGFGACSIRFNVTDMVRDPKPDDLAKYNLPKYGWLGRAWQLLELSLCNVQADPGALAKAVGEGALARNEASALAAAWRAEGDPEEEAPAEEAPAEEAPAEEAEEAPADFEALLQAHTEAILTELKGLGAGLGQIAEVLMKIAEAVEAEPPAEEEEAADETTPAETPAEPATDVAQAAPWDPAQMRLYNDLMTGIESKL